MKKEEKTELTKERILQAAVYEFGTKGYEATTLNALCNGHDISKGLFYHNFSGKDELYLFCVKRCFADLTAYMQLQDIHSDVYKYLELRFQYFTEHPLYARIFFETLLQPPASLAKEATGAKSEFDAFNRSICQSALSKLTLRRGVAEEDALKYYELIQEMFNGYFNSPAFHGKDFTAVIEAHENALKKILDFILYGIAERGKAK